MGQTKESILKRNASFKHYELLQSIQYSDQMRSPSRCVESVPFEQKQYKERERYRLSMGLLGFLQLLLCLARLESVALLGFDPTKDRPK